MFGDPKNLLKTILTALAIGCVGFFGFSLILQPVFSGKFILPQSFGVGAIQIHYYGAVLGLAVLGAYWLANKRRDKFQIQSDDVDTIALVLIISGFLGARIYHIISELPYYLEKPLQMFAVWQGGLSIFGAIIGGLLGLVIYSKYFSSQPKSLIIILDWLAPSVVLGQIIGRFGNFLNYELYGYPTNLPWKMFIPIQYRQSPYEMYQFFHPLFLYEAAGSAVILYLLLRLNLKSGRLFLLWLLLYNVLRFFLEHLRADSIIYSGIRINAVVALVIAAISAYSIYKLRTKKTVL